MPAPVCAAPLPTVLLLSVAAAAPQAAGGWVRLGSPVPCAGRTMTPRVEVLAGRPHVTFTEQELSHRGSVRAWDATTGSWVAVGAPGTCSSGRDWWSHLAVGPDGTLFRASYEYGLHPDGGSGLNLRRFSPATQTWVHVGTLPLSTGEAHTPDLAVDAGGIVYAAYRDGPVGNDVTGPQGSVSVLRIVPHDGSKGFVGGAGFSDHLVGSPRSASWNVNLALGADGSLWAAWSEFAASDRLLGRTVAAVARFTPAADAWELVGGFGLGHGAHGEHIALAVDPQGRPYVAVYVPDWVAGAGAVDVYTLTEAPDGLPPVWTRVGSRFGVEDDVVFSPEAGYRESLALAVSPDGRPHVAYRSRVHGSRLCAWGFDGAEWARVGPPGFTPPDGEDDYPTLAFWGSTPLVAFRHGCSDEANCLVVEGSTFQVWAYEESGPAGRIPDSR